MKPPPTIGKKTMLKFGLGDVVAFNKSVKSYRGAINYIEITNTGFEYYITHNGESVKVANNARLVVGYKFKKGQSVNSFHYNDNMRSTTYQTGVFCHFVSEKIAIVKFGTTKREVRVDGLEPNRKSTYMIGNVQTRRPIQHFIGKKYLANTSHTGLSNNYIFGIAEYDGMLCIRIGRYDRNGNMYFEDVSAASVYITKRKS